MSLPNSIRAFLARENLRNPRYPLGQWLEELPPSSLAGLMTRLEDWSSNTATEDDIAGVLFPIVFGVLLREMPELREEPFTEEFLMEAHSRLFIAGLAEQQRREGWTQIHGDLGLSDGATGTVHLTEASETLVAVTAGP